MFKLTRHDLKRLTLLSISKLLISPSCVIYKYRYNLNS